MTAEFYNRCEGFGCAGIVCGVTDRRAGNMRNDGLRRAFLAAIGLPPESILMPKQVHGDDIVTVSSADDSKKLSGQRPQADGWLLTARGTGAAVYTADCVPVFVRDSGGEVAGIAHAGWRGVAKNLPQKLLRLARGNPLAKPPFYAHIGPHIKSCCFEIKEDVARQLGDGCVPERGGKLYGDMSSAIRRQLAAEGLPDSNISESRYCTACYHDKFFSWRRGSGEFGQLSFIFLR